MSEQFTTIFFDYGVYTEHKISIQKLRSEYGLKWNQSKQKRNIPYEQMIEAFKLFNIKRIVNDEKLKGRSGSVGIWEGRNEALKIMMLDKVSEDEHLPIVLVYKGSEDNFYKDLLKMTIGWGCEISKVVNIGDGKFEEVFKKRINIKLVEKLNTVEGTKEVLKESFLNKINEFKNHGDVFSEKFVKGWQELIDKYGYYKLDDLGKEIEKVSEEKNKQVSEIKNINIIGVVENKLVTEETSSVKKKFKFKSKGV